MTFWAPSQARFCLASDSDSLVANMQLVKCKFHQCLSEVQEWRPITTRRV